MIPDGDMINAVQPIKGLTVSGVPYIGKMFVQEVTEIDYEEPENEEIEVPCDDFSIFGDKISNILINHFCTYQHIMDVSDDNLLALKGIGKAAVKKIRKTLDEWGYGK